MDKPLNIYSILLGIETGTESTLRWRQESNKYETRVGCTRGRSQGAEGEGNETIFIFFGIPLFKICYFPWMSTQQHLSLLSSTGILLKQDTEQRPS